MRSFLIVIIGVYSCKIPSENYFHCIPEVLVCCALIFIHLSRYFLISLLIFFPLTHCFFKNMFNFRIFLSFPVFLLLLTSSCIPHWPKNILCGLTWFIVENVSQALEKNMYSATVRWSVLYMLGLIGCSSPPFPCSVIENGVLKSPKIILELVFLIFLPSLLSILLSILVHMFVVYRCIIVSS